MQPIEFPFISKRNVIKKRGMAKKTRNPFSFINEPIPTQFEKRLPQPDPVVIEKLKEALDSIPPEKMKEFRKGMGGLLEGETKWLRLFTLTPEQKKQIAEAGYLQFQSARYDAAHKIYRGLTIIDPENYYYHAMLGAIHQRKEEWAEAILEYSMSLMNNPKDLPSYTNRGESYLNLGLTAEALRDLKVAVAGDPEGKNPWGNRARMLLRKIQAMGGAQK